MNMHQESPEQRKSSGTTNSHIGNTSMQEANQRHCAQLHRYHSHLCGDGEGGVGCAIRSHKIAKSGESTVTRSMTQASTIPVTVCSNEMPGLAGGAGVYHGGVGGEPLTRRRGTVDTTTTAHAVTTTWRRRSTTKTPALPPRKVHRAPGDSSLSGFSVPVALGTFPSQRSREAGRRSP